jgi:His/Glu/Gln/Arg/opine family amino acid ABC transporter permease subunit
MTGQIGQHNALDALKNHRPPAPAPRDDDGGDTPPAAIVGEIQRAKARARFRFRLFFVLTWLVIVGSLGVALAESGKVDPTFLGEWGPFILGGVGVTIFVSVASILLAVFFAVFGALGRLSGVAPIYAIATLYVSLVRGTPLIVQIIFIYIGLPQFGIVLDPLVGGIFALGFNYGAYLTEIFRAGIEAIPRGQREAAGALGMTEAHTMRRVILPQAVRIVIPAIGNDFISMIKDSALVSLVTIQELFFRAESVGTRTFRNFETLLLAALVYWLMTIMFSFFQERLEKRMAESDVRL